MRSERHGHQSERRLPQGTQTEETRETPPHYLCHCELRKMSFFALLLAIAQKKYFAGVEGFTRTRRTVRRGGIYNGGGVIRSDVPLLVARITSCVAVCRGATTPPTQGGSYRTRPNRWQIEADGMRENRALRRYSRRSDGSTWQGTRRWLYRSLCIRSLFRLPLEASLPFLLII